MRTSRAVDWSIRNVSRELAREGENKKREAGSVLPFSAASSLAHTSARLPHRLFTRPRKRIPSTEALPTLTRKDDDYGVTQSAFRRPFQQGERAAWRASPQEEDGSTNEGQRGGREWISEGNLALCILGRPTSKTSALCITQTLNMSALSRL